MSEGVTRAEREALLGQRARTLWLTGLSGAGKTTLCRAAERRLHAAGRLCYVLDGDVLRTGLCRDLGLDPASRAENVRRAGEVCRLLNDAGAIVLAAFVSPYEADRERTRAIVGPEAFRLVHLATSLSVCQSRDPKGLYARAAAGALTGMTGLDAPYEPPTAPDAVIDTATLPLEQAVDQLLALLD
mgnify:CR=1 FL=1